MPDPFDNDDHIPFVTSDVTALLKEKAPRAALLLAGIQAAYPGVSYIRKKIRNKNLYTVKVQGGMHSDGLYEELHEWILSLLPAGNRKSVIAYAAAIPRGHRSWDEELAGFARAKSRLRLRYDGDRVQVIEVRGHKIRVTANNGNMPAGPDGKKMSVSPEINFSMYSEGARDALLAEIEEVLQSSADKSREPVFRILNNYDEWESADHIPPRPLESVILSPGQLERITADIQRFLDKEGEYNRRCIPWHRGHLYSGEAGTGKTSTARAIAAHFALDMWYLPLGDVKKDFSLVKTISTIRRKGLLLLEDVDVFHIATSRDDDGGSTLSGLLNSLDGISTPHGLITIMTANRPEVLDEALVRKGRIDLKEHFALSGAAEAARLVSRWYDANCPVLRKDLKMSASDVSEVCKGADSIQQAARALNGTTPQGPRP